LDWIRTPRILRYTFRYIYYLCLPHCWFTTHTHVRCVVCSAALRLVRSRYVSFARFLPLRCYPPVCCRLRYVWFRCLLIRFVYVVPCTLFTFDLLFTVYALRFVDGEFVAFVTTFTVVQILPICYVCTLRLRLLRSRCSVSARACTFVGLPVYLWFVARSPLFVTRCCRAVTRALPCRVAGCCVPVSFTLPRIHPFWFTRSAPFDFIRRVYAVLRLPVAVCTVAYSSARLRCVTFWIGFCRSVTVRCGYADVTALRLVTCLRFDSSYPCVYRTPFTTPLVPLFTTTFPAPRFDSPRCSRCCRYCVVAFTFDYAHITHTTTTLPALPRCYLVHCHAFTTFRYRLPFTFVDFTCVTLPLFDTFALLLPVVPVVRCSRCFTFTRCYRCVCSFTLHPYLVCCPTRSRWLRYFTAFYVATYRCLYPFVWIPLLDLRCVALFRTLPRTLIHPSHLRSRYYGLHVLWFVVVWLPFTFVRLRYVWLFTFTCARCRLLRLRFYRVYVRYVALRCAFVYRLVTHRRIYVAFTFDYTWFYVRGLYCFCSVDSAFAPLLHPGYDTRCDFILPLPLLFVTLLSQISTYRTFYVVTPHGYVPVCALRLLFTTHVYYDLPSRSGYDLLRFTRLVLRCRSFVTLRTLRLLRFTFCRLLRLRWLILITHTFVYRFAFAYVPSVRCLMPLHVAFCVVAPRLVGAVTPLPLDSVRLLPRLPFYYVYRIYVCWFYHTPFPAFAVGARTLRTRARCVAVGWSFTHARSRFTFVVYTLPFHRTVTFAWFTYVRYVCPRFRCCRFVTLHDLLPFYVWCVPPYLAIYVTLFGYPGLRSLLPAFAHTPPAAFTRFCFIYGFVWLPHRLIRWFLPFRCPLLRVRLPVPRLRVALDFALLYVYWLRYVPVWLLPRGYVLPLRCYALRLGALRCSFVWFVAVTLLRLPLRVTFTHDLRLRSFTLLGAHTPHARSSRLPRLFRLFVHIWFVYLITLRTFVRCLLFVLPLFWLPILRCYVATIIRCWITVTDYVSILRLPPLPHCHVVTAFTLRSPFDFTFALFVALFRVVSFWFTLRYCSVRSTVLQFRDFVDATPLPTHSYICLLGICCYCTLLFWCHVVVVVVVVVVDVVLLLLLYCCYLLIYYY